MVIFTIYGVFSALLCLAPLGSRLGLPIRRSGSDCNQLFAPFYIMNLILNLNMKRESLS